MSKLKQLIAHLQAKKSSQDDEVEYLVYRKSDGAIISIELSGPTTAEVIHLITQRRRLKTREDFRNLARQYGIPRGRNTGDTIANLRKAGLIALRADRR